MGKKIIVAGGGHGGLSAAARLAKAGFDVTVYEKNARDNMGYDWTDIFAPQALQIAGIPMPSDDKFEYKYNMTFYNPSLTTPQMQDVRPERLEIKMERKDIYEMLITHAEKSGVKFQWECAVLGPIMSGTRVVGIKTAKGDVEGDLVIDACGLDSPVRKNLPAACGIEKEAGAYNKFTVYRAFYNKLCENDDENLYRVYLLTRNTLGVNWLAVEDEYVDILIGRFTPFDEKEIEDTRAFLKETNPTLGDEVNRGGQFVYIPVRQPLSVLVCDGYAAIGDSAFMTVPFIGSGIANSLKASMLLCDAILDDKDCSYDTKSLWKYQYQFYKKQGAGLAPLACLKNMLTVLTPEELDFMFEKGILTGTDLTIDAFTTDIFKLVHFDPKDMLNKVTQATKDRKLIAKIAAMVTKIGEAMAVTAAIPPRYGKRSADLWQKAYLSVFRR